MLPLAIGRAAESDVVTPVAVAVCALTLGPAIFAFFLGTGRRPQGSNFTRIYNETYANSRFNRFLLDLTRLQKQRRRAAARRTEAQRQAAAGRRAALKPSKLARAGAPLPLRRRGKRPAYFFCAGRWRAVLSGLRRLQRL